jgi:hypothetical protein
VGERREEVIHRTRHRFGAFTAFLLMLQLLLGFRERAAKLDRIPVVGSEPSERRTRPFAGLLGH